VSNLVYVLHVDIRQCVVWILQQHLLIYQYLLTDSIGEEKVSGTTTGHYWFHEFIINSIDRCILEMCKFEFE